MKNIFKKNQIIITALAIMIVIAGYLTFSGKDNTAKTDDNEQTASNIDLENYDLTAQLDDETLNMNDEIAATEEDLESADISDEDSLVAETEKEDTAEVADATQDEQLAEVEVSDTGELTVQTASEAENPGEAVLASSVINAGFFSSAKLSREQTRAKNKETINEIIENANLSDSIKQDAINRLIEITKVAEIENATEIMLETRGFDEAVVSIVDGKVDVVVNAITLSDQQLAQIEDIVTKKTDIALSNINIYPVVTEE